MIAKGEKEARWTSQHMEGWNQGDYGKKRAEGRIMYGSRFLEKKNHVFGLRKMCIHEETPKTKKKK
jgi:hypothetical protein